MRHLNVPNPSITLRRADSELPVARVTVSADNVLVEYGRLSWGRFMVVREVECLPTSQYPELSTLYVRGIWDMNELYALIMPAPLADLW